MRHRLTSRRRRKSFIILTALSFTGLLAIPQAQSEPQTLAGGWTGGGIVAYASGERERARCRANYSEGSSAILLNATCATQSGNVSQDARLHKTGANSYSGTFFNSQYNTNGSIHVVVRGNTQSVTISSGSASASLTLHR